MRYLEYISHLCLVLLLWSGFEAAAKKLIVSPDGKGDFKSIQAALASLSDTATEARVIFIKKGIYKEKIYIEKHNIILEGEDRNAVVLTASVAREAWRCVHADDWGVATLNIDGNDITLKNLTVINSFGFDHEQDHKIACVQDTAAVLKNITRYGHQMALRTMAATRFKALACTFKSYGGDTVSPWNVRAGLFYFKDCLMEGGVDLYCPRGWAYAEGCHFVAHRGEAALWHDGSQIQDSKTVLNRCFFEGYEGFKLGRYHRDAQFFLLDCTFASQMADRAIYRVETNNTIQWGHRVYYYNCHRQGGDYAWFADNIASASLDLMPPRIDARWVFGDKWNPEKHK